MQPMSVEKTMEHSADGSTSVALKYVGARENMALGANDEGEEVGMSEMKDEGAPVGIVNDGGTEGAAVKALGAVEGVGD